MPIPVGRPEEVAEKAARVRSLLPRHGLKGVLLRRSTSAAWLTGGAHTHVGVTADNGASFALVTADKLYILTNRIEQPRLHDEERLEQAGFEFVLSNWYEPMPSATEVAGGPVGYDGPGGDGPNLLTELAALRFALTADEIERYRWLGATSGAIVQGVARMVTPGLTEDQIAGRLSADLTAQGIIPSVLLVATDERIFRYRHPLPTAKRLDRYAMLVIGARRWGLHVSCTRLVHFGAMPADLRRLAEETARIDAVFVTATRPGAAVSDIFRRGQEAYAAAGRPDEWQMHHQGGACGYGARDYLATPTSREIVVNRQAFAWNPSIAGAKSEDTIIVGEQDNEIITAVDGWPMWTFIANGRACQRPLVLERP